MESVFLILAVIGIIITIIFGILQVIVNSREGKLNFSKRFPFVTISTEEALPAKAFKKARQKKRKRKNIRKILIPLFSVVVLGIAFLLMSIFLWEEAVVRRTPIAVMAFKNWTGESSFDDLSKAIPNLLITNLEQSKYFSVMTWERMHDLLKGMGKEDVEEIDEELAFELCRMEGIEAIVLGSFTKAGEMFATDVKVLDVETKELLKSTSSKGEGVASILKSQIDELSRAISRGVGLSERKIEATKLRIADVTTTSMDAYNYFLRGRDDYEKYYFDDARKFLEKAVQLDSTFAVAYLYLAYVYSALGNNKAMNESYEKAKTFSQTTTDKERFYIEAAYASAIERNPEKGFRILKKIAKKYPKEKLVHLELAFYLYRKKLFYQAIGGFNKALELDPNYGEAINSLAHTYGDIGNFEKAIEYFNRYASVSPGNANPFDSMGDLYFRMGKLDDAIAKYREALEIKLDFGSDWKIAYIYALKENYPEAMKWVDQFIAMAPSPGIRAEGYWWKGFYHYWLGSLDQSLSDLDRAVDLAEALGNEYWKAGADWTKGWVYHDLGELEDSRMYFNYWFNFFIEYPIAYEISQSIPFFKASYSFYLGLVDLKEGRIDFAKSRLTEMKSLLPEVDPARKDRITFYYDLLYAEVLLAGDSLKKAIAVCEKKSMLEIPPMSTGNILSYNAPFLKDVLARAYLQKGELDKSIAEYERLIIFDPESQKRFLIHPINYYLLAQLYEEKGSKGKAIAQYEKFLEIWKDADPSMPEVEDAKTRLAKLKVIS